MSALTTTRPATIGNNIAQLLCDIGEASASTDPIELFRLCLDAQRLLTDAHIGNAPVRGQKRPHCLASSCDMAVDGQNRARQHRSAVPRAIRAAKCGLDEGLPQVGTAGTGGAMNDNLVRLSAAFRRLDEEAQRDCVCMLESVASTLPAVSPTGLRLVSGNNASRTDAGRSTHLAGGTA